MASGYLDLKRKEIGIEMKSELMSLNAVINFISL
jgi:hypothetical protein